MRAYWAYNHKKKFKKIITNFFARVNAKQKCRTKRKTCSISRQIKFRSRGPSPPIKHWKIIKKFFVELMEIELQTRLKKRKENFIKIPDE